MSAVDPTAVRVALWRAMHRLVDSAPWVLDDDLALPLATTDEDWRRRPDMHPGRTSRARATIVGRARYVEDHVAERAAAGVGQYVALGAGLDSFALRTPLVAEGLSVFEVDQPSTQDWKRERLAAIGVAQPELLHWVPVNFEAGESWWQKLCEAGFDPKQPAVFSSLGVTMYLTREAVAAMLAQVARSAAIGSTVVLSFTLPLDRVDAAELASRAATERHARAAGTPFLSLYGPEQMLSLARHAGFASTAHVSSRALFERYFAERADGLRPSSSEELLVADV